MRKDNTQNYNTRSTNIKHFRDLEDNSYEERDELEKVKRSYFHNDDHVHDLPNLTKYKFNKVTRKMDDISQDVVRDKIDSLDKRNIKRPKHSYKIVKFSEAWGTFLVDDPQIPILNRNSNLGAELNDEIYGEFDGCGCCDECEGSVDCDCCDQCTCSQDYEIESHKSGEVSYMFFNNLETIMKQASHLRKMNQGQVDKILNDGHNWAEDHMSTTKENLSHVHGYFTNKISRRGMRESMNYMFFGNLETIQRLCKELLSLDRRQVDGLLTSHGDWAEDHVASAKETMGQVYDFLLSELN